MSNNQKDFIYVDVPNFHLERNTEIKAQFPEVKDLMGPHISTLFWIIVLITLHLLIALFLSQESFLIITITSYLIGSFFSHALYVLIHECTHNLVFKKRNYNKVAGIICDLGLVLPSAIAFRKYHMIHHRNLNEHLDPDVSSYREANFIKNIWWKKLLWLTFFIFAQALRPLKLPQVKLWDKWLLLNLLSNLIFHSLIFFYLGQKVTLYLFLSQLFGLGLHPLGGRWIQEHYVTYKEQETYSYYGFLNKLSFNIGYHNEHHDFMNISWINLPKVRALAPEYYNSLKSYQSWSLVVYNFIFNKEMSPFRRIIHASNAKEEITSRVSIP